MKYGACPTYILRDHEIIEVESKTLPMGIISPLETMIQKQTLKENDMIFMVSDGFSGHFREFLKDNEYLIGDDHPKDIAHLFMTLANDEQRNDDMTIMVLKICKQ